MIHYDTWNQYTTEIPLHRLTKQVTHNIQQPVFVFATSNLMKNHGFATGSITSLFLQHQTQFKTIVFCKEALLWDQSCLCLCNTESDEKQWFLQSNANV